MSSERIHLVARLIVRTAAALVPGGMRDEWTREWHAELAALSDVPLRYRRPVRRACGAFADAFWLRQQRIADFDWIDDVRHGLRQLGQHAGFAATAIGILALGLAATVTMFSVTDQILLRPLPYPNADRIVTLWEMRAPDNDPLEVAPGNLIDWRMRARSFDYIAGVDPWALDIAGTARPEVWFSAKVTEGFFESFAVTPLLGRFFEADEYQKGRDHVLVLGEAFWRQRFGGDPSVVGRTFTAEDGPVTVVGIVPASFEPRLLATATGYRDVWQPKAIEDFETNSRGNGYWGAVGRLKPGIRLETAQAEMTAISRQLATEYPRTNQKTGALVRSLRDHLVGNVELAVAMLGGAVALVLLIACVNVANLLLARGAAREREIAVRVALGARRGRLIQQLLLESLIIAGIGGIVGSIVGMWALSLIARTAPSSVPWVQTLHLNWRALGFAFLMSGVVAIVSGLLPAWRVARSGLAVAGRNTATPDASQHRLRASLVIAEVAIALVLVTGAGLLIRSFIGLMNVDPGFQRDRVLVAQVFAWDHNPTPAHLRSFFNETISRLSALPAVQHVGAVSAMPFIESNINIQNIITFPGRPPVTDGEAPRAFLSVATPGYFEAMRIPLKAGRQLHDRDGPDSKPVIVITDTLARRYWSSTEDSLGDRLRFRFSGVVTEAEIVGVVGSLRHDSLDRGARDELFMPLAQKPFGSMTFVLRSASDASGLLEPARAAIWSVNPAQTIYRSATLDELVRNTVSSRRFTLAVVIGFAAVALLLAIAGVYGVLSTIMTSRLREVGLRVALGASRWDIVRLVLSRGLAMAGAGLVIGVAGSLGAAQLIRGFLFQITPADPFAIAISAGIMMLAALAACYLPARRAAAADPVTVLRTE
jgi:putative ABC transport system permease protein